MAKEVRAGRATQGPLMRLLVDGGGGTQRAGTTREQGPETGSNGVPKQISRSGLVQSADRPILESPDVLQIQAPFNYGGQIIRFW